MKNKKNAAKEMEVGMWFFVQNTNGSLKPEVLRSH